MLFKVKNLTKKYKNNEAPVLDNICFELPEKGLFSIVGKSGSGKTTLLNILGLIDKKTEGEIFFRNHSYSSFNEKDSDSIRKNEFSFIFQDFNLINDLTVYENLAIPLYIKNDTTDLTNILEKILKEIGLEDFKDKKISELSGGQIERVAIGRALVKESSVIFCDEPTANLDNELAESIFSLLKKISENVLVIVVSHNVSLVEKFSDSIFEINDHKLILNKPLIETKKQTTQISKSVSDNKKVKSRFLNLLITDTVNSLKRNKLILILSFFLFLSIGVLFNTTFSLYNYHELSSYINSFEKNQNYCIRVSKYLENNSKYFNDLSKKEEYLGFQDASFETNENDYKLLEDTINNDCDIYKNYTYNCPLNYFNNFSDIGNINDNYASSFMFFTSVQNFNNFNQPLKLGRLPQTSNEVLIYDYMDESFQFYNIFNESVLNKTITDFYSKVSFKVVGILKSEYDKWIGFNDNLDNKEIGFSLSNLNELRTIIGFENFLSEKLNIIQKSPHFIKVNFIKESSSNSGFDVVKTYFPSQVETLENQLLKTFTWDKSILNFISEENKDERIKNFRGFAITKRFAMDLVSITDENEFDESSFGTPYKGSEAFLTVFRTQSFENIQKKGDLYAFFSNSQQVELFGIIDDTTNSNLYFSPGYFDEYVGTHNNINGTFSYFLVSLTKDKSKNKKIISNLIKPDTKKDDSYYESLLEDKFYFFLFNGTTALIGETKIYVKYISNIIKVFFIISIIISVIFSFYFIFTFIKKNFYKFSLYKSMGLSKKKICFLSLFLPSILVLLSFIISIPFSYLSMHFVNNIFLTNFFNLNLSILNLESISLLYSFLLIFGTIALGVLYPIINLYKLTPMQLIRAQK